MPTPGKEGVIRKKENEDQREGREIKTCAGEGKRKSRGQIKIPPSSRSGETKEKQPKRAGKREGNKGEWRREGKRREARCRGLGEVPKHRERRGIYEGKRVERGQREDDGKK
jgi:hypothetical protein